METKQTAVEWFYDKLENHEIQANHYRLFQQAKQMEKEQIKDAWLYGQDDGATICTPNQQEPEEQYYNETYKK